MAGTASSEDEERWKQIYEFDKILKAQQAKDEQGFITKDNVGSLKPESRKEDEEQEVAEDGTLDNLGMKDVQEIMNSKFTNSRFNEFMAHNPMLPSLYPMPFCMLDFYVPRRKNQKLKTI